MHSFSGVHGRIQRLCFPIDNRVHQCSAGTDPVSELENLVFLDLKRRGYSISIGRLGTAEVDFVATREREQLYIQVAYLLENPATVRRETAPLMAIEDNYPKFLITLDRDFGDDIHGIHRLNLQDFLLRPDTAVMS